MTMRDDGVSRRRLLAASLGAAAVLPLAGCSTKPGDANADAASGDQHDAQFGSPSGTEVPMARNVRDFGATGDGRSDDTDAIARAASVGNQPSAIYLPAGVYRVTSWPQIPDYSVVLGDGSDVTTIRYEGDGTLIALRDRQRVSFKRLGMLVVKPAATAVSLSQCFRCSFDSVVIRGGHVNENYPQYANQRGVVLDQNTGGTTFINCDINNFGVGLTTSCIQNYLTASKLTSNYIGVLGTGNDHNAGLSMTNVEFVSDSDAHTTDKHLYIDGAANDWWLTNVWFEGADIAVSVGHPDRGGPAQFGMVNCHVAARTVCLDLAYCRQPYLANVAFDQDADKGATELRIDPVGCPEGTAVNLISGAAFDLEPAIFPDDWNVVGRSGVFGCDFVRTLTTRASDKDADLMQAQANDGTVLSAVLSSGAWLSDRASGGVILKDAGGAYWRLSVSTNGTVQTSSLGKDRPHG
jgi:hypothetical protein